jgi:hypothetical protein
VHNLIWLPDKSIRLTSYLWRCLSSTVGILPYLRHMYNS